MKENWEPQVREKWHQLNAVEQRQIKLEAIKIRPLEMNTKEDGTKYITAPEMRPYKDEIDEVMQTIIKYLYNL